MKKLNLLGELSLKAKTITKGQQRSIKGRSSLPNCRDLPFYCFGQYATDPPSPECRCDSNPY